MADNSKPEVVVQDSADGVFKQLGVLDNGVFVGFAQVRLADYNELVAAGSEQPEGQ